MPSRLCLPQMDDVPFQTSDEALSFLKKTGQMPDADIDLGEAALALGLLFLPGLTVDRYRQHLVKLAADLGAEYETRPEEVLKARVAALRKVIHETHGYKGDAEHYDDIQNANLIRVIERRRGLPVALGLLYVILSRKMGWVCDGLSFPGHFLLRLEAGRERVILDPFREGREMGAADLRQLLKSIVGRAAELSHDYYNAVSNREMLVRLQNNLKKRLIEGEDYRQALRVAEAMNAFAPDEYRVWLDKGVLHAKLGQNAEAAAALETYIEKTPDAREKQQAHAILQQIKALET